jgi:two-component system, cell cycle sensor histidine kinase and response regulator CckA
MAQVLEMAGYTVMESATAEQAIAHLEHSIAMLITDVMLPGKSGRDLAREMRSQVPGIKTILVSGYGENFARLGSDPREEVTYLPKPFSVSSLLSTVRSVMCGEPMSRNKAV